MENQDQETITGLRKLLFPVYRNEFKKVIPIGVMYLGLILIYTITRLAKDMFMMGVGDAEVLSAAKIIVGFIAIGAAILHGKISRFFSRTNAFLVTFSPFLVFYLFFGFASRYTHIFHMSTETINYLISRFPYFKLLIISFGHWMYLCYYVFSELFAVIMITATFWQFANYYTSFDEKKRFYPFYSGVCAQIGTYGAGEVVIQVGKLIKNTNNGFLSSILLSGFVLLGGVVTLLAMWYLAKNVQPVVNVNNDSGKKNKQKGSIKEIFIRLKNNPNVILACFLVVFYGLCASSMELFWKKQVGKVYPVSTGEYSIFMGRYQQCIAICSIVMGFVATNILQRFNWLFSALVTPIIVLLSSSSLFGFIILQKSLMSLSIFSSLNIIKISVIIGFIGLCLYKCVKYTFYDPTLEMYLGNKSQEVIFDAKSLQSLLGRSGKSTTAAVQFAILCVPGMNLDRLAFVLWPICLIVAIMWIYSIISINKEVKLMENEK